MAGGAAAGVAERRFALAWAAGGGGCHADIAAAPSGTRRRGPVVPPCAVVPRVTGLPLQHSPAPCALAFLQRRTRSDSEKED